MNKAVTLIEYHYLYAEKEYTGSGMHFHSISKSAFTYLKSLCLDQSEERVALKLKIVAGCEVLQVQNYAGVLITPDGTQIEILPKIGKHADSDDEFDDVRQSLFWMLKTLKAFRHLQTNSADIQTSNMSLLEIFIKQFLGSVNQLLKRGLRSDYVKREENLLFLKGKLNVKKQLTHNMVNKHRFYVEYDEFLTDRPINRLIKTALVTVGKLTRSNANQKQLRELLFAFDDVPVSRDYKTDISRLRIDRGMSYYQTPLAWAKIILENLSPQSMKGQHNAISLLFPMEAVFESYVAAAMKADIKPEYKLQTQVREETLVTFKNKDWFRLKPDLLIEKSDGDKIVLDTKWKMLDQEKANGTNKFGLSQSDFYQMFAYGHKYLKGKGDLILIYPYQSKFTKAVQQPFVFHDNGNDQLRLWVVPFEIKKVPEHVLHLPSELRSMDNVFCKLTKPKKLLQNDNLQQLDSLEGRFR